MSTQNKRVLRPVKSVWIGLVEVAGHADSAALPSGKGAHFNALAPAASPAAFVRRVKGTLARLGVDFIEIEDVGRFPQDFQVPTKNRRALLAAAKAAASTGVPQFTTWHVFDLE